MHYNTQPAVAHNASHVVYCNRVRLPLLFYASDAFTAACRCHCGCFCGRFAISARGHCFCRRLVLLLSLCSRCAAALLLCS